MSSSRAVLGSFLLATALLTVAAVRAPESAPLAGDERAIEPIVAHARQPEQDALQSIARGRQTFRHDTFGGEAFWGDTIHLDDAIAGAANGGVGPGLSPSAALALGLKVDVAAVPRNVRRQLAAGQVDLNDPAVTLLLLQRNAVIGVKGFFNGSTMTSVGIQCSLCHSTVDDSFAPGIGERRDGWANRDLDVGKIVALAPDLSAFATLLGVSQDTVRQVLRSWGPGKFDAELILDGKAFQDPPANTKSAATLIPPAFGLAGVNLHTWTGWGSVTHWNAFVANLEMHGKGTFFDPRLDNPAQFPIAAANGFDDVRNDPRPHHRQARRPAPLPARAARPGAAGRQLRRRRCGARGRTLFAGKAACATCHVPPLFTEPGWNMHLPSEIGIDSFQADRSPDHRYRTSPLKGLWTHTKGGFYHDGRFPTLLDVVNHYNGVKDLGLTEPEKADLVQYLLSL